MVFRGGDAGVSNATESAPHAAFRRCSCAKRGGGGRDARLSDLLRPVRARAHHPRGASEWRRLAVRGRAPARGTREYHLLGRQRGLLSRPATGRSALQADVHKRRHDVLPRRHGRRVLGAEGDRERRAGAILRRARPGDQIFGDVAGRQRGVLRGPSGRGAQGDGAQPGWVGGPL